MLTLADAVRAPSLTNSQNPYFSWPYGAKISTFNTLLRMKATQPQSTSCKGRREGPLRLHSQTVSTRHPSLSSASKAARSRSRFPAIFALKSVRVAGSRNIGQPWPCQKHPWTRITARCFGKTRSGWPRSDDTWRRKRMPARWRPRCSRISGLGIPSPDTAHIERAPLWAVNVGHKRAAPRGEA